MIKEAVPKEKALLGWVLTVLLALGATGCIMGLWKLRKLRGGD